MTTTALASTTTTTAAPTTTTTVALTTTVRAGVSTAAPSFGDGARLSVELPTDWLPLLPGEAAGREMWSSVTVIDDDAFAFRVFAEDLADIAVDLPGYANQRLAVSLGELSESEILDTGPMTIAAQDALVSFISSPAAEGTAIVVSAYLVTGEIAWVLTLITLTEPEEAAALMGEIATTVEITT
ncbi:MAG: hypothetical protein ACE5GC_06765 [Acidimicrobiia bacterium]